MKKIVIFLMLCCHSFCAGQVLYYSVGPTAFTRPDGLPNEVFITDFYRKLQSSGDIAESLHQAKLKSMEINRDNGFYDWAGYQLFIK